MSKPLLYLAIGDSIGVLRTSYLSTGSQLYPAKIRDAIRTNYGQCKLINKCIGGMDTTKFMGALSFFTTLIPDIVTIELGMNDCNSQAVSVSTYTSNLNTLIDRLRSQNPNVKIILCTPSRTNVSTRTPYIQSYRDAMAQVATNKNVSICHLENAWTAADDTTMIPNDVDPHPTPAGQTALFNTMWTIVQTALSS